MFLLLAAASAIYLVLGDVQEALVLLASVLVILVITVLQQRKTERALEALRDLSSPRATVVREGVAQRIAGSDVVRGDLLLLAEGDRVPADARLVAVNDFIVDESLLTGESLPVEKSVGGGRRGPRVARLFRNAGGEGAGARDRVRNRSAHRVRSHRRVARDASHRAHASAARRLRASCG
jgi:magnesium-transporting ATPase (P-type)